MSHTKVCFCIFDWCLVVCFFYFFFFCSSRRRHTRCALVTGVQTCALPIFPPRNTTWGRDVIVLAAIGLALLGLAPMGGHPGWAIPGLVGCITAAIARGVLGRRSSMRADLSDRLVEALSPSLGLRAPDPRVVQLSKWTPGWPGEPRKVPLKYAPDIADDDPTWRHELVNTARRRPLAHTRGTRHTRPAPRPAAPRQG